MYITDQLFRPEIVDAHTTTTTTTTATVFPNYDDWTRQCNMGLGKRKRGGEAEGNHIAGTREKWGVHIPTAVQDDGRAGGHGKAIGFGMWNDGEAGPARVSISGSPKNLHLHQAHVSRPIRVETEGSGNSNSNSNPWTQIRAPSSSSTSNWGSSDGGHARPTKQARRTLNLGPNTAPAKKIPALAKWPSHLMDIVPADGLASSFSSSISELDISNSNTNAHTHTASTTSSQASASASTSTPMPTPSNPSSSTSSDLRPCHICHKAPNRKRDLEGYIGCRSCGERACYVCTRVCVGTRCQETGSSERERQGEGQMGICSRCCVEVGREGEVWCRGCLGEREGR
ncbi:hypothetical protein BCR34DRAFT_612383 [Clohesyomyces aquaticus]|uniref:Uncharacterized protein n=1 Tax=Clohesyomyces aquaticus TaxID=1231657 RepID=A0A1Y1ZXK4_9PLEO|nr:hypothetical protein BCR34DRAFT_612383 [Clohesyomyces aquaticus]